MALIENFQRKSSRSRLPGTDDGVPTRPLAHLYDEAAFRYFLAVDRRRAERSSRSLLLVLATIRIGPGRAAKLSDTSADAMFAGLRECFREVDFVGWFRQRRVAAALLVQGVRVSGHVSRLIADRARSSLSKRLSADQAAALHVRVVPLGSSKSEFL